MSSTLRGGPSRQPSLASASSALGQASPAATPSLALNPSQRFRRLVWDATIPIAVHVEGADLAAYGASANRSVEVYYARAPRISYLPLLLQEVRKNLLGVMLDPAALAGIPEEAYWFTADGTPLRWHWPIGLLYDYHAVNMAPSQHRSHGQGAAGDGVQSLTSSMRKLSATHHNAGSGEGYFATPFDAGATAAPYVSPRPPIPWQLTLRIGNAPLDKLHSAPGLANCRSSYMSMVKEADFVRYGSTKRVTNLRRTEQDALWEGVINHDFEVFWPVASKLVPNVYASSSSAHDDSTPGSLSPSRATSISSVATGAGGPSVDRFGTASSQLTARPSLMQHFNESQSSLHSAAPSESNMSVAESVPAAKTAPTAGQAGSGGAGSYRSLPMRFHLVNGAPVVQEPVAPYTDDGRPVTLHAVLSALFPLLFPPTPTFAPSSSPTPPSPLAYPVIQGIRIPLEAEIPWIGSVLPSADGWVAVCIHLLAEGERL